MPDPVPPDDPRGPAPWTEPDAQAGGGGAERGGYPEPAYPPAAISMDEPHLLDYTRVLYKRRYVAAAAFTLVVLGVAAYTFTATPIYQATAKLLIESDTPNVVTFREVVDEGQARQDYYQTQYDILQSRSLAAKTLDGLKLWEHPEFAGTGRNETMLKGVPATAWSAVVGFFRGLRTEGAASTAAATPAPAEGETAAQTAAIGRFLSRLSVAPVRNSRIVNLSFRSPDAALAARVANAHARHFIEQNLEHRFLASKEASDWLGERLAEQRRQVEATEASLQRYREEHGAVNMGDRQSIVVQKLADLNAAFTKAATERIGKEALYRQLQAIQADRTALDTFPAIQASAFIQQLKAELARLQRQQAELAENLGDKHPDLLQVRSAIQSADARLQGETGKVVQAVRNEFLAAQAQERSLSAALDEQKRDALSMNRAAIEHSVLQREMESARSVYDSLLQRAKETGVSAELRTTSIRVVDQAARPLGPASPRTRLNMLLALVVGGAFGIGLAFFLEYLDNCIKTPDEVKVHLGIPSLGFLPLLSKKAVAGGYPLINNGVPPGFSEAFRGIRTNVLFSSAEQGSRSVVVTSTGPGEGKTMVSANLAVALAQAGQRVLLVDGDLRRPAVHKLFPVNQEPGLSNLLVGNAKPSDALQKSSGVPGLWVLAAGRVPPNPVELLGSVRFREFLASLAEHFDWIVIDSPPVMAVTDASVAAHVASGVLFVVAAEMTNRHAAQTALEQLRRADARFVGAVLNRVDLQHNAYYYSQYYRREYGEYYQQSAGA